MLDQQRLAAEALAASLSSDLGELVRWTTDETTVARRPADAGPGRTVVVLRCDAAGAARAVARLRLAAPRDLLLAVRHDGAPSWRAQVLLAGADTVVSGAGGDDRLVRALGDGPAASLPREQVRTRPGDRSSRLRYLTPRERATLDLLAQGATTADLVTGLCVTPSTARSYVQSVLDKLGAHSRLEAVACVAVAAVPVRVQDGSPGLPLLVVDGDRVLAGALAHVLAGQASRHVAWTSSTAGEALALARLHRPAVLLLGQLPEPGRGDLLARLRRELPDLPVVVLVPRHGSEAERVEALHGGAHGSVSRDDAVAHVARVLEHVRRGDWWWSRASLVTALRARGSGRDIPTEERLSRLTTRERQVLASLVRGVPRSVIATDHRLSVSTVRTHVQHVLAKLEVHSSLAAVALVRDHGGLEPQVAPGPTRVGPG